jgi:hypothetical protein
MESTMQEFIARRRLDGSIDIEFYRQRGLIQRRMCITRFFKGMGKPFVAAAIVLLAISMMPARDGTGWDGPVAISGVPVSASLTNPATATR